MATPRELLDAQDAVRDAQFADHEQRIAALEQTPPSPPPPPTVPPTPKPPEDEWDAPTLADSFPADSELPQGIFDPEASAQSGKFMFRVDNDMPKTLAAFDAGVVVLGIVPNADGKPWPFSPGTFINQRAPIRRVAIYAAPGDMPWFDRNTTVGILGQSYRHNSMCYEAHGLGFVGSAKGGPKATLLGKNIDLLALYDCIVENKHEPGRKPRDGIYVERREHGEFYGNNLEVRDAGGGGHDHLFYNQYLNRITLVDSYLHDPHVKGHVCKPVAAQVNVIRGVYQQGTKWQPDNQGDQFAVFDVTAYGDFYCEGAHVIRDNPTTGDNDPLFFFRNRDKFLTIISQERRNELHPMHEPDGDGKYTRIITGCTLENRVGVADGIIRTEGAVPSKEKHQKSYNAPLYKNDHTNYEEFTNLDTLRQDNTVIGDFAADIFGNV